MEAEEAEEAVMADPLVGEADMGVEMVVMKELPLNTAADPKGENMAEDL